jgi:hypothetical protein
VVGVRETGSEERWWEGGEEGKRQIFKSKRRHMSADKVIIIII